VRTYLDGGEWKVAGMHGKVKTFASYEELLSMTEIEKSELAEKVRNKLSFNITTQI
jgi:hypothetical protein